MPGRSSSVLARGNATLAREVGERRGVKGFEAPPKIGDVGGPMRQAANKIVHAPVGQARDEVAAAKKLLDKATHTPTKYTSKSKNSFSFILLASFVSFVLLRFVDQDVKKEERWKSITV
jgi:hypothetical protein